MAARVSASPAGNGLARHRSGPSKPGSSLIVPVEFENVTVPSHTYSPHAPKWELSDDSDGVSSMPAHFGNAIEKRPHKKVPKSICKPAKKIPRSKRAARGNAWDFSSDSESEISGNISSRGKSDVLSSNTNTEAHDPMRAPMFNNEDGDDLFSEVFKI